MSSGLVNGNIKFGRFLKKNENYFMECCGFKPHMSLPGKNEPPPPLDEDEDPPEPKLTSVDPEEPPL